MTIRGRYDYGNIIGSKPPVTIDRPATKRICRRCGNEFSSALPMQRMCCSCGPIVKREKARKRAAAWSAERRKR